MKNTSATLEKRNTPEFKKMKHDTYLRFKSRQEAIKNGTNIPAEASIRIAMPTALRTENFKIEKEFEGKIKRVSITRNGNSGFAIVTSIKDGDKNAERFRKTAKTIQDAFKKFKEEIA